ncbi:hypothetical protein R1sor_018330 [Riccia sorocarpa]|uniref:RNA helicase n=1 Tax=Riccia sorocarpa TaxID=122646 RepID=A0ABD3I9H3_9MARC
MGANGKLDDDTLAASKKSSRDRHLRKREHYDDADEREFVGEKKQYGRDGDRSRKDESKSRDRSEREKRDGDRVKDRDSETKTRDKEEKRSKDKDSKLEKEREKERSRDKDRDREKDRERAKSRDREREKEKDREKSKRKERRDRELEFEELSREREREKEKERREKEKSRETPERPDRSGLYREREKDEERKRERERELLKEREKKREKEKRDKEREKREREKLEKADDEDKDRDRKKRRKSEDADGEHRRESEENDLDEEQKKLDEEVEKRRRRVQEWQELKRRKEEEERKKRGDTDASTETLANGKTWTLEGDDSDDEDGHKDGSSATAKVMVFENGDVVMAESKQNPVQSRDEEMGEDGEEQKNETEQKQVEDDEVDPLDAFMNTMILPEVEKLSAPAEPDSGQKDSVAKKPVEVKVFNKMGKPVKREAKLTIGRIIAGEDSASDNDYNDEGEPEQGEEDDDEFMKRVKKSKAEKLALVDHSKMQYASFRKNFYIEVKEISRMTPEEVMAYRKLLELKVRGKDVPLPIKTWNQTGLSARILEVIKKSGFEKPMPIQAQALPIIMSGRDCIGVAKTGSGKTLAFVLPMLRHIMDQSPLAQGDGPIGLIMAPTRELVQQIYSDIKRFSRVLGLTCVPVYGGSGVAQQISDLKRGAEIVVCTPGRMIDILCTSAGKIMNLRRVTYLVMDEADRMFDMGFEPQITRIVQNTRPDRQTVLFSATFPRQVEVLARKVLNKPVEIQVGGRSVANKDITQTVEVRPEGERFLRLLELLGEWYEKGKILIFVHSQEKCDSLFRDLLKAGYPCLSLHGAKDQTDRESTLADFKSNVCNLMIATSVAARGLDVKELELVVNYDVPNHYEDYVHRVGRTGRAGRKGVAVTFISAEEERYAPDLVKALVLSEQPIPDDLKKLADDFMAKVKQGSEQVHGSGYGGSGFKFNEEEEEARKAAKKAQAKEYGFEEDEEKSDSESEDEGIRKAGGDIAQAAAAAAHAAALAAAAKAGITSVAGQSGVSPLGAANPQLQAALAMAQAAAASQGLPTQFAVPGTLGVNIPGLSLAGMQGMSMGMVNMAGMANMSGIAGMPGMGGMNLLGMGLTPGATAGNLTDGAARASAFAAALNLQHNLAKIQAEAIPEHYEAELEINDFPQHARWKVTHKDALGQISEWTGAAITTRGQFFPPGKVPAPGERKLFLFIEGPTEASVKKAKAEVKRLAWQKRHGPCGSYAEVLITALSIYLAGL